ATPPAERLPAEERKTPRRPARLWAAVLAAAILIVSIWELVRPRAEPSRDPSGAIAVLPFTVRGGEAVHYLGDGIVSLLGAALDGADGLRPVDARATFAV